MSEPGAQPPIPPIPPIPDPAGYDPELPILAELESEYRRELTKLRPVPRQRRGPHRELAPGRITRRALLLVALVSLVGASALAGSGVFSGANHRSAATQSSGSGSGAGPVLLSAGGAAGEHWLLQAYTHGASTCYALFVAETATSDCAAPPTGAAVRVSSALGPEHRLVAGIAGPEVAQVLVRVGAHTMVLPTYPLPRTAAAAAAAAAGGTPAHVSAHADTTGAARLPADLRWLLAVFPGESPLHAAPAHVTPLNTAGHAVGPSTLDCSLGANNPACQRAAASIATGAGD